MSGALVRFVVVLPLVVTVLAMWGLLRFALPFWVVVVLGVVVLTLCSVGVSFLVRPLLRWHISFSSRNTVRRMNHF